MLFLSDMEGRHCSNHFSCAVFSCGASQFLVSMEITRDCSLLSLCFWFQSSATEVVLHFYDMNLKTH